MATPIGFVGLGAMGGAIVRRLSNRLARVTAFDTTPAQFALKRDHGKSGEWTPSDSAKFGETVSDCALGTEGAAKVLCLCLPTSQLVETSVEDFLSELDSKNATWRGTIVDFTSGDYAVTQKIASRLRERGIEMVDAAVSGGPPGAAAGTLSVMVGGDPAAVEKVRPFLDELGSVIHLGPVGSGHAVKSVNNCLNTTHLLVAAEGLAALTKMGVDPSAALEAINKGSGRSLQTERRIPDHVLTRKFAYDFKLGHMLKDVRLCNKLLERQLPQAEIMPVTQRLVERSVEEFGFDADYTEVVRTVEKAAGVEIVGKVVP